MPSNRITFMKGILKANISFGALIAALVLSSCAPKEYEICNTENCSTTNLVVTD